MATRIMILPDDAINKIAAGEVVERPASIVKELVENAIDSGADRITVEVWRGGRDRIRVTDNGCGMSQDDALLSLERHATSKIRSAQDLWGLRTLGFRGEALPSIAAVSRMTIETRDPSSAVGTRVDVEGGEIRQVSEVGRSPGTTISVDQVFYNTPARRKFLKAPETEWRHISQAITGLALANAGIGFSLSHDDREAMRAAKSSLDERLEALFRVRIGEEAVSVALETEGITLKGYVEAPEHARKSGTNVIVVNGRWVRHRGIALAVSDGYGGLLQKDVSPSFALCLDIDGSAVDVNVHPSKREVRFTDARVVYRTIADAVRASVRESGSIPDWAGLDPTPVVIETEVGVDDESLTHQGTYDPAVGGHSLASEPSRSLLEPPSIDDSQITIPLSVQATEDPEREAEEAVAARLRFFQLHASYILAQVKQGLIIVDQNLAHQRILYDEAVSLMSEEEPGPGQALLFPGTFEFGLNEIVTVREVLPYLEQVGFGIRDFGGNTVVVDAIPAGLEAWNEGELLREMVSDLISERTAHLDLGDRALDPMAHYLAAGYARRVAIPHGRVLQEPEMENLIDKLFACAEPYTSPSGRLTLSRLSMEDIGRRFTP